MKYIEVAVGMPSNRNIIIKETEIKTYVARANMLNQSLYRSYYTFDENIIDHMKIYKTVRSFKGLFMLDKIIIDIDRGKSSDQLVLLRARDFIQRLEDDWKVGRELMRIWYSGTGYHVTFPDIFDFTPSSYLPDEVEATLGHYFPEMDTKPLMRTGLIRVGYSFNSKSNLFKIPVSFDELNTLSHIEIMELAQKGSIRKIDKYEDDAGEIPNYHNLIMKAKAQRTEDQQRTEPTRIITCSQKIFLEGALDGSRHVNLVRLVSVWRLQGIPFEGTLALVAYWNNNSLSQYELEKQVKYIWDRGYTMGCKDEILLKYCSDKCIHWKNKDFTLEISSAEQMESRFSQYMKTDFSKSSFTLNEFYPKLTVPYTLYPAELVIVLGDTKIGKSTLVQNWCIELKRFNILYLALENGEFLTYRRFIQIAHRMTKIQVFNHYMEKENSLSKAMDHIHVITTSPDIPSIRRVVAAGKYQLVVIDVIDGLTTKAKGDTEKITEIAVGLKEIANQFNNIILGIHHISRSAAQDEKGNQKRLTIHSGKSASALEQKADKMLGIEGLVDGNVRTLSSLGARDENPFITQLEFNKDTFRMEQI